MQRDVDILNYYPNVITAIEEFQHLANAVNPELNKLWAKYKNIFDNQFISTLDESGCLRWEKLLKITAMGTDTLEDRRFRILASLNENIPYTYRKLENMLTTLCGNDYTMQLQNNEYRLIVRIALSVQKQFNEVKKLLTKFVPANIIIDLDLRYNQYNKYLKNRYKDLSIFTYKQLRSDENIDIDAYTKIENKLTDLCGQNRFSIQFQKENRTLFIKIPKAFSDKFSELEAFLNETVPKHIYFDLSCTGDGLHNEYITLTNSELAKYTHKQLSEGI